VKKAQISTIYRHLRRILIKYTRESEIKVRNEQAHHIIINLSRSNFSVDDISDLLKRKPVKDLQELNAITKIGEVIEIYPI